VGTDNLHSKYWIRSGLRVYHTDDIVRDDKRNIYVEYLIKKGVPITGTSNGEQKRKKIVVGVMCHWNGVDKLGNTIQIKARYGINELVPADIVDQGNQALMSWSERVNKL